MHLQGRHNNYGIMMAVVVVITCGGGGGHYVVVTGPSLVITRLFHVNRAGVGLFRHHGR